MTALGVALALGVTLIITTLRADQLGEATSTRVSRRAELARQFRADVADAAAAPDTLGDQTAGPTRLLLTTPGGGSVVYRWDANTLERVERTAAAAAETVRVVPVGPAGTVVELVRPAGGAGVVTIRVTEPTPNGLMRRAEISAALGGNRR